LRQPLAAAVASAAVAAVGSGGLSAQTFAAGSPAESSPQIESKMNQNTMYSKHLKIAIHKTLF